MYKAEEGEPAWDDVNEEQEGEPVWKKDRVNSVTATKSTVVVIVRIEANYRSVYVEPWYPCNFTYS